VLYECGSAAHTALVLLALALIAAKQFLQLQEIRTSVTSTAIDLNW
jgi:hypothetical protein